MNPSQVKARNLGKMVAFFGVAVMGAYIVAPTDASALCMAYRPMSPAYQAAQQAMRTGNHAEGIRLFRQAEQYPGQATGWISQAFMGLGMRAEAAGQADQAREHFRTALREQPHNSYAAFRMVESFLKSNRPHDALGFLNTLSPQLAKSHLVLRSKAKVLEKLGDHAAAKAVLESLKRPRPVVKPVRGGLQAINL